MANLLNASHMGLARAMGEQRADRDIARKERLNDTDCAAYDDMNMAGSKFGAEMDFTAENIRTWQDYFAKGYAAAFEARERMIYQPDHTYQGHVMRACFHCRARYVKNTGTAEGREYEEAAIIICVACIERMAVTVQVA